MVIEPVWDDPERNFSSDEQEQLTRALLRLTQYINGLDIETKYDQRFVQKLHLQLFHGVRDHAGRFRGKDYGETYINFGPNRSVSSDDVSKRLEDHFFAADGLFGQLDSRTKDLQFIESVIKVAAYIHADLIRIHPFRDGNGRVSRLVMNFVLRKYGFPLLTVNVPKQEYLEALNYFYAAGEIQPLCELFIRVYFDQLES